MSNQNAAGGFLLVALGLLVISMFFNYTAFSSFSNVLIQQIAFISMALLFDTGKILSAIQCKNIYSGGNHVIGFFIGFAFVLLTIVSIVAGYIYLSNMMTAKKNEKLKESVSYQMGLSSINQAQTAVDKLIQFSSPQQAETKQQRLTEIEEQIATYNSTQLYNYNKTPVGTFGQLNKCGIRDSYYNKFCTQVANLNEVKYKINNWLSQHEAYLSTVAIVGQRQQALVKMSTGNSTESQDTESQDTESQDTESQDVVVFAESHGVEPFVSFMKWFGVSYIVAVSFSMFVLAVMCELTATLFFMAYSVLIPRSFLTKPNKVPDMPKDNQMDKPSSCHLDTPGALPSELRREKIVSGEVSFDNPKHLLARDTSYEKMTNIITTGICRPTVYSIKRGYGLKKKMIEDFQHEWLKLGLIESYDRTEYITSYRLKTQDV